MSEPLVSRSAERAVAPVAAMAAVAAVGPAPERVIQELWFALSGRPWRSAVLVPAGRSGSTVAAASALAEVGRRLRLAPVATVLAGQLDYDGAAQLIRRLATMATAAAAPEQLVIAVPPVVVEPLGVAVARQADEVVLCLQLGVTSLAEARRTIELVGVHRITGCLVLTS